VKRSDLALMALPLLLAGIVDVVWLNRAGPEALVRLSPQTIDVGRVLASEPLRLGATITNTGCDAVRLGQPRMECGVIDAVLGTRVLEPNGSTGIEFTLVPSPFGRQERTIVLVDGDGAVLTELAVACEVEPSIVAVPSVLQTRWEPDGIRASFTLLESDTAGDGSLRLEDLDVGVEGDLRLVGGPKLTANLGARIRIELLLEPSDPRLFGALEGRVHFRHSKRIDLHGSARLLTERPVPGAEADWPACFRATGVGGATFRFPLSVHPHADDAAVGPQWVRTANAWVVQVPTSVHAGSGRDVGPLDLQVAQGVIRLRLDSGP